MGTGYTRNDTANNIADGNVINASDIDGEFDAIQSAFNATTGHSHDGTTGEGPQIGTGGIADLAVTTGKIANDAVTLGTKTSGNYVATIATSAGLDGSASSEGATPTISLNLNELTTSTTDGDGDYFVVVDTAGTQRKLTKANIAVSGFNTSNGIALGTDTTGNYVATGAVSGVGLSGSASAEGATFTITSNATNANTGSTIVARDASGNFSAGTITAALTGTASNAALLDSLDSTQFLRSDAADTKTSGDLSFADNVKAIFGAGSDLQIYHDGSNSYIQDAGTGSLFLQATNLILRSDGTTENYMRGIQNGAVELFYDGSKKFETTATGVDVTGTVTADDVVISGANPTLTFFETDTTNLNTKFDNGGGDLYIQTVNDDGSSPKTRLLLDNATGDISFYDNTGVTQGFFWDASTQRLGLGTTSPDEALHISASDSATLRIESTDTSLVANQVVGAIEWESNESSVGSDGVVGKIDLIAEDTTPEYAMRFFTHDTSGGVPDFGERMRIDSSGNVGIGTSSPSTALDVNGVITTDGMTTSANINFGDSDKAMFGAGNDLQIYHENSNSFITDNGDGDLYIRGSDNIRLQVRNSGGTTWTNAIKADDGAATSLMFDGSTKLATTSYGIDISGSVVADTHTDTSQSGSQTANFNTYQNFVWTLTGNLTLANPSTEKTGQSGFFIFIQDGTGSRTVSLGTDYETAGGAGLTLSTAANSVDIVPYVVQSSGNILLGTPQLAFS